MDRTALFAIHDSRGNAASGVSSRTGIHSGEGFAEKGMTYGKCVMALVVNTGDLVGTLQVDGSSRIMNITSHNTTIEREALINYLHCMKSFVLFLGCHT